VLEQHERSAQTPVTRAAGSIKRVRPRCTLIDDAPAGQRGAAAPGEPECILVATRDAWARERIAAILVMMALAK
jgi:hypothetical protein